MTSVDTPPVTYGREWPDTDQWADQDGVHHEGAPVARPRGGLVSGGAFILDEPEEVPAVWGAAESVLWSHGEPLVIVGPTGAGKTTLAAALVQARMGLADEVLGYPVQAGEHVLYLACDRPRQIGRAVGRNLRAYSREVLDKRLTAWWGPPPADLARHPERLLQLAHMAGADTVVLDSLKDVALGLSTEEVGQGIGRAMNLCVSAGVEVLATHHDRKSSGDRTDAPDSVHGVYGSMNSASSVGSLVRMAGATSGTRPRLHHLKAPADLVPMLELAHDHATGTLTVATGEAGPELSGDEYAVLAALTEAPQTLTDVIRMVAPGEPTRNGPTRSRVQRHLDKLVAEQLAHKVPNFGPRNTAGYALVPGAVR